jgi:DNA recombination protein RmuC
MEILFSFLGGLVLATLIAFFIARSVVKSRVAQTEQSVRLQAEAAFKEEQVRLTVDQARLESDLEHAHAHLGELAASLEDARDEAERQVQAAKEEAARWHKEAMDALQARFDETMDKVSAQMKSETSEMLKARQKEFSETSHQSLGQIVDPLKENIAELRKAMEEGNKEQAERNGEMRERIRSLMEHSDAARKSAEELAAAFKHGSKMQGDWGETILEELLASQGLTKGVHFDTQPVIRDGDGKTVRNDDGSFMKPDVILHLDERREVIIDSKVSLTAFVDYVNADSDADRQIHLKAHLESIKKHVKELAVKDYASYVRPPKVTAGYVIMFVPNMGALWTALNAEPGLWRKAADQNVYIADEQTLYGALKIVSMTWTQVAQAQNHEKVYELANEMIDRVGLFMEKYEAVGKALQKASDEYDEGMKKLQPQGKSILNTSAKLIRLGAKNSGKHPVKALLDIDDIPPLPE